MTGKKRQNQTSGILEGFPSRQNRRMRRKKTRSERIIVRRSDPLKLRTVEEWRSVFALEPVTDALICASRRVFWDYPKSCEVTCIYREPYHDLIGMPSDYDVEVCLIKLGYHPVQAHRAAIGGYRPPEQPPVSPIPDGFRDDDF